MAKNKDLDLLELVNEVEDATFELYKAIKILESTEEEYLSASEPCKDLTYNYETLQILIGVVNDYLYKANDLLTKATDKSREKMRESVEEDGLAQNIAEET